MRHTACALLGVVVVLCCCQARAAEEPRFRWWPFGGDKAEETAPVETATPAQLPSTAGQASLNEQPATSSFAQPAAAPSNTTTQPPEQAPLTDYSSDELPERRWMFESPMAKVSWPRIHLPEMPRLPRPQFLPPKSEVDEARNAWVQENPDPGRPSPLQAAKQGAERVRESTRSAWRKTVDVLTPGSGAPADSSRIAREEARPPFWKRMFTAEEPQQEGPRTVTEWMAQERLDP
jgi:hypothetical protein